MTLRVAIVGSGPAGFYTAEAIAAREADVQIDLIEKLPTPFGLIRAGVAPDHQTTKNVTRRFEKTAMDSRIFFVGNVSLGEDIQLEDLQRLYDAVVIATGAQQDRDPRLPGQDLEGCFGSATFVAWYNGHPEYQHLTPDFSGESAVVIGHGNVGLDVARVLMRSVAGRARTDIARPAASAIDRGAVRQVHFCGRRGALEAKFTNVELRELDALTEANLAVKSGDLPNLDTVSGDDKDSRLKRRNLETLWGFARKPSDPAKPKTLTFRFCLQPVAVLGDRKVEAVRFEHTRVVDGRSEGLGTFEEIPCSLAVMAVGYRSAPIQGLPFDEDGGIVPNEGGRVAEGLYVSGWIRRGPRGVISSNRKDGQEVAEQLLADVRADKTPESAKAGHDGLIDLLGQRGRISLSYADWKRIDDAEVRAAVDGAPRQKFVTRDALMDVLRVTD
ncbi:MAG: FAD-dependent oxidoreductase [Magnetovibrionaceae bacterium]